MGVNFYVIPNLYLASYIRECASVNIFSCSGGFTLKRWLFNATFLKRNKFMILFQ